MIQSKPILPMVLAVSVLMAGPAATVAPAQEELAPSNQRVVIWRTEADQAIDLEAVGGHRGFLGVGLLNLTPELRLHFGVPSDRGIMVSSIVADSPAERAGLLPADILTAVDGDPLPASIDLSMRVASAGEGAEIELECWREGQRELLRVPIETQSRSHLDISPLIVHRIKIKQGRRFEVEKVGSVEGSPHWIEEIVETVDNSFSEATFLQQLEALRRERSGLLEVLLRMEERLEELEGELHRLDSDHR